jgi:hypothetical protein
MSNITYYNVLRVSKIETYNKTELENIYSKYIQLCNKKEKSISENDKQFHQFLLQKSINNRINKSDIEHIYDDFNKSIDEDYTDEEKETSKTVNIDVIIPKDKLNDFRYILHKLCDVKCNILQHIAKKNNCSLDELVDKYIPEMNPVFFKELYTKYKLKINP